MIRRFMGVHCWATLVCTIAGWMVLTGVVFAQTMAPKVGTKAPEFALKDVGGASVALSQERSQGPVVLIVGRGWPGYQCPFCTRQFAEFRSHASELQAAGATVLWIYPGPADELAKHAGDFIGTQPLPPNFRVLIDPGYAFTRAYDLRWDAPHETAYPATFVVDRDGTVLFANVSLEHGGRTPVADVLKVLDGMMH
ncbi:MAG TPA: peroxiredoxin family protein [Terriglobia bacterium]|nr:peroxiredoxin family protein [Terriglobia bacterium]